MAALVKAFAKLEVKKWDGKPISMPGIYSDIPIDDYHSGDICIEPSVSSSGLRKLYNPSPNVKASPAHYWVTSPYNNNRIEDDNESDELILGRAAHHLLFGQVDFDKEFAIKPAYINGVKCDRTTTHGKLWYQEQAKRGLTVIKLDQIKAVQGIARELEREPLIVPPNRINPVTGEEEEVTGILNGLIEHSIFCKHRSGLWLKVRPDAIPTESMDYVDLKTTRSIIWPDIQRSIRDYGYFMQAGLTAMVVQAVLGQPLNSYTLVFAESREPHCIEIITLKENDIARGIAACEIALTKFVKCWQEKRWPGPRGDRADAQYLEMTEFDQRRIDEAIALDRK